MNHMRIYLLLNHYKQKLQLSDEGVRHSIAESIGVDVTFEDLEQFNAANPPSKKALAVALKADGYKPKDIADMISATIYDTRYYLSNPPKGEYVNIYFSNVVQKGQNTEYKLNRTTYVPPNLNWNTKSE